MVDWIVVGAGFTGATLAERIAAGRGERVLVVERRDHVGGNAYDAPNEHGILVHRYGPHIFHTASEAVWAYLSRFTAWRPYEHRVRAVIDGREVPIPFNLNTIDALFPPATAARYARKLTARFPEGTRVPILKLLREEDGDLATLARYVYEKLFRHYTFKQWGLLPEQLSPSVTARVPIVVGRDDRYFDDRWQAMPAEGYTPLFRRMLDHPRIELRLSTEYRDIRARHPGARTIYTGPIDEFFDGRFGRLPYRSLRFDSRTIEVPQRQSVAQVNYPGDVPFTRITEMKHLTGQSGPLTTLVYEYPETYVPGINDPYYPIPQDETRALLQPYLDAAAERPDVVICGRLGDYRYYNMDQAVGAALARFRTL